MRAAKIAAVALMGLATLLPVAATAQITFDAPGLMPKQPKAGAPSPKAAPEAWPRLDPGAVLCRSAADLARLAANRQGLPGGGPADCQLVSAPTPISILHREGPGRTEVQVTAGTRSGQTGWTDAWLPNRPPAAR